MEMLHQKSPKKTRNPWVVTQEFRGLDAGKDQLGKPDQ